MELVLASGSPYRRALLERLGVAFRACPAPIDEDALALEQRDCSPTELTGVLARAKAGAVAAIHPQATIIGSDQLAVLDGRPLGKPGAPARAAEQLAGLVGRSHELITALAVWHRGQWREHTVASTLHMRRLSSQEIQRYLAADEPFDCAGSYKIEARGIALFERIDTPDFTAITGLPLIALTTTLRELGYRIP